MGVPSVHVAMTFSHELGEKVFSLPESRFIFGSIADVKRALDEDNTSIFAQVGSPMSPVLSLNHKLPADLLELRIIDPFGAFEGRVLGDNRISTYLSNQMREISKIYENTNQFDENVFSRADIQNLINFDDFQVVETEDGYKLVSDSDVSMTELDRAVEGFLQSSRTVSKIFDDATNFGDSFLNTVYITYGIGDNIDDWAGPFLMKIMNAKLEYDGKNGVRILNLLLQGNTQSLFSLASTNFGTTTIGSSYNIGVEGTSKPILKSRFDNAGNRLDFKVENIQELVDSCVSNYIQQMFNNDNILLMLPALTEVAPRWLNSKAQDFPQAVYEPIAYNYASFDVREAQNMKDVQLTLFQTMKALEDLKFFIAEYYLNDEDKPRLFSSVPEKRLESLSSDSLDALSLIKKVDYRAVLASEISLANLVKEGGNIEFHSFLDFLQAYRDVCTEKYPLVKLIILTETDPRILKIWKSYGLIKDDTNPAVILGDAQIIETLLYSKPSLNPIKAVDTNFYKYLGISLFSKILVSTEYIAAMQTIAWPLPGNHPLGDIYNLPSDVKTEDISKDAEIDLDSLKRLRTPILKHGFQDSNVLGIELENNLQYYAALGATLQQDFEIKLVDSLEEIDNGAFQWFSESLDKVMREIDELFAYSRETGRTLFMENKWSLLKDLDNVYNQFPRLYNLKNITGEDLLAEVVKLQHLLSSFAESGDPKDLVSEDNIGVWWGGDTLEGFDPLYRPPDLTSLEREEVLLKWKIDQINVEVLEILQIIMNLYYQHALIKNRNANNKLVPTIKVNKDVKPIEFLYTFADELHKNVTVVNAKTIPMFYLSNTHRTNNQKVIVLSREPIVTGADPNFASTPVNRAFTGLYYLVSLEQVINGRTAETIMKLVQKLETGLPVSDNITRGASKEASKISRKVGG